MEISGPIRWLKDVSGEDVYVYGIVILVIWELLWHLFFEKKIYRICEHGEHPILNGLLELRALGTFAVALFALVLLALYVQAVILAIEMPRAIPAVVAFVLGTGIPIYFILRKLTKK